MVWLLVASIFAVACIFLSQWQFDRRASRLQEIALVQENYDQSPLKLSQEQLDALRSADSATELSALKWHPVILQGRYLNDQAILIRNRPQSGQPGFETVVPFETNSGLRLAVSRGWLPTGNLQDSPDVVPLPSENPQTLTARLVPSENPVDRTAPDGQAANFYLPQVAKVMGLKISTSWYLQMSAESIPQSTKPAALLRPSTDEGNHLSYAIQWIIFGVLAFVVLVWAIRREYEFYLSQTDPNFVAKTKRRTRAEIDQAIEDGEA